MRYERWIVGSNVIAQTEAAMLRGQHEVFVMWPTKLEEAKDAVVSRCIVPAQQPGTSPYGVYVHIDGEELQRIQLENFSRGEYSVVQLHTHPSSDVRMSQLDREWEVVRHVGALSIIVPSYCAKGLLGLAGANVYERESGDWRLWSRKEVDERIVITP
jgi:proteasome lid subunit RPN8/RPN11